MPLLIVGIAPSVGTVFRCYITSILTQSVTNNQLWIFAEGWRGTDLIQLKYFEECGNPPMRKIDILGIYPSSSHNLQSGGKGWKIFATLHIHKQHTNTYTPVSRSQTKFSWQIHLNARVIDIDVIFLWEVATNNKQLSLLTSSILQTSSVKIWAEPIHYFTSYSV